MQNFDKPGGFQEVEAPRFQENRHMPQPQGHSAAGRIMSIKNFNDTIGNRTRDLPACTAVPQPTALPRASLKYINLT